MRSLQSWNGSNSVSPAVLTLEMLTTFHARPMTVRRSDCCECSLTNLVCTQVHSSAIHTFKFVQYQFDFGLKWEKHGSLTSKISLRSFLNQKAHLFKHDSMIRSRQCIRLSMRMYTEHWSMYLVIRRLTANHGCWMPTLALRCSDCTARMLRGCC